MKIKNIEIELSVDSFMRKVPTTSKRDIRSIVEGLMCEYSDTAAPRAVFTNARVEEIDDSSVRVGESVFSGTFIQSCMKNKSSVYPFIITLGKDTDDHLYMKRDVLSQYLLDQMYTIGLIKAERQLRKDIQDQNRYGFITRLSPGSLDEWPITEQRPLFSLLGAGTERIGVELDRNCIMHPSKSLSGIIFQSSVKFSSCVLCPRQGCPGREQQYNPARKQYYLANI